MFWDKEIDKPGYNMPFMPKDGYVSMQNPPDFTWTGIPGSEKFDIIVCQDKELKSVKYSRCGVIYNFYNFDTTFEVGVKYYWAVRCYKDGIPTEWSEPRMFRIHPRALEFTVPEIGEMLGGISSEHPRICTTKANLAKFRAKKDKNKTANAIYNNFVNRARHLVKLGVIGEEPTFEPHPDWVIHSRLKMELLARSSEIVSKAFTCGFAYLLTGEKEIARFGIDVLLSICKWDINGSTSYKTQDQVHRDIAYRCAMAYDWLADAMTDDEKKIVLDMIRERTKVMEYLLPRLKNSPYDSHGWTAFGYIGVIAIATYGEIPEADAWLRQILPQYTVILPPWSYQDGGWSQGTDYWQYSTSSNKEFIDVLREANVIDLYKKAWQHNEYLWTLYAYPAGLTGSFGDQSNRTRSGGPSKNSLYRDAYYSQNGVAKWLAEKYGSVSTEYYNYNLSEVESLESRVPASYQLSHHFRDIGWVVMSNDIFSSDRISMTFKSSPFGSFNHSHADQNSFIIQAYGENLAIKSGYYDAYHSKHDSGFTRKTHAHNSVTMSKSRGQKDDLITASGSITSFLTHCELDLATGDATPAYIGTLDKFKRHMIYLRPDLFVVVDDLRANAGKRESFEWWLNAEHEIEITQNGRGARITEGIAALDASVVYPESIKAHKTDKFEGSDGVEYPAAGSYTKSQVQKRVWFETDEVESTKMVVVLDTRKKTAQPKAVKSERFDDYLKLTVEGCEIFVNLSDGERIVTECGVEFDGAVAVVGKNSAMLAEGKELTVGGDMIFSFEKSASAVIGVNELSVSTREDNTVKVGIGNRFAPEINSITDYYGAEVCPAIGVVATETDSSSVALKLLRDEYAFMLNGKLISGNEIDGKLKLTVDGQTQNLEVKGFIGRDGNPYFKFTPELPLANYRVISASKGCFLPEFPDLSLSAIASELTVISTEYEVELEIQTEKTPVVESVAHPEFDEIKAKLDVFLEAESFVGRCASGASVYSTREFLSGGAGVTGFNNPTSVLNYEVEIPEDGVYDFAIKYVSWESGCLRSLYIDGEEVGFKLPKTESWGTTPEEWRCAIAPISKKLEKGMHKLTLQPRVGVWNIDWLGFLRK